jgi:hypothetical protein
MRGAGHPTWISSQITSSSSTGQLCPSPPNSMSLIVHRQRSVWVLWPQHRLFEVNPIPLFGTYLVDTSLQAVCKHGHTGPSHSIPPSQAAHGCCQIRLVMDVLRALDLFECDIPTQCHDQAPPTTGSDHCKLVLVHLSTILMLLTQITWLYQLH